MLCAASSTGKSYASLCLKVCWRFKMVCMNLWFNPVEQATLGHLKAMSCWAQVLHVNGVLNLKVQYLRIHRL